MQPNRAFQGEWMKKKYTIGEVSKIMGLSTQTLRYYSSIDLLKPAYINPDTGYRYYTEEQFHFIDRIRYLQKLGMSLDQIKEVISSNDIQSLIRHLEELEKGCRDQIEHLNNTIDTIRWYKDYFIRSREDSNADQYSHVQHFPKRYLVSVRIRDNEDRESYHIRLTEIRNKPYMQDLPYMRQYSLLLDYNDLINMQFRPLRLGMFIKDFSADMALDQRIANNVMEIPEGDYFCFRSRILSDGWNPYLAKMFFSDSIRKPGLVLANEYEDSLTEYHNCPYEVQILINDGGNSHAASDN